MATTAADPYADQPKRWVGKTVRFDHSGKRLVGVCLSHTYTGRTARGSIPDYLLTVRGTSGTMLDVSLVESKALFDS